MKEIILPINQTVSLTFTSKDLNVAEAIDLGNGQSRVSLGKMIDESISTSMAIARKNGGAVLYATTSIEQQMENILLIYFMDVFDGYDEKRDIFEKEILQSSALSYNSKKELMLKIVNTSNLLTGKKKNNLQKHLKFIMVWRNAFAHGTVRHDSKRGCFIKYFSGGEKKQNLTDDFWSEVENSFTECSFYLKEVLESVRVCNA